MTNPVQLHHVSGLKQRMIYDLQINMNGAAFPEVLTVLRETELVSCLRAGNGEFVVCCRISRDRQLGRQTDGHLNKKQQKVRMCEILNVGALHVDRTASARSNEARGIRGQHLVLVAGGIIWDSMPRLEDLLLSAISL